MQPIEIGDLSIEQHNGSKQHKLFHAIRDKIVFQLWPKGGKLPSTRKLALTIGLSRNTVINAYEQLQAEGYIESQAGSGYFVSVELPEQYLSQNDSSDKFSTQQHVVSSINHSFAPGVPDLQAFPSSKWQKIIQRHASRTTLLGSQNLQGDFSLRQALSEYLASSRSVHCNPDRIIITSGAQQALYIALMSVLKPTDSVLMEQPGYAQASKVLNQLGNKTLPLRVLPKLGIDIPKLSSSNAKAAYLTPSNQYPMGTTLNTEERIQIIQWANQTNAWIIEDDYDSEFQFAHRPYTSLQGLAEQMGRDNRVIYIGSFSKTMFNALRIGYLVVPEPIVQTCLDIKDATSGSTASHTQAALADFIIEGELLRHIRKMRRLYNAKYLQIKEAISEHFGSDVEIVSQAAGLHVTLYWKNKVSEHKFVKEAMQQGLIVRPLSYYETRYADKRTWNSVVLGYGNTPLNDIAPRIKKLATIFYQLS